MKIDLHCHTKAIRRGELDSRNVTKEQFATKVVEANVKIVAITNHDTFDRSQFETFQQEAGAACTLWPGIEFNIEHDDEKYHMIVIASPHKLDEFESAIISITDGKVGDFDVPLNTVLGAFNGLNVLYLPHFGNKTPGISQVKLSELYTRVPNVNRVILEDSNSRSTAILSSHGMRTITGSDVKDWDGYQSVDVSELRIPVDTFEQFCLFLDRDPTVIKTLLDKNHPKKYVGRPSKEDQSIAIEISLFSEVNIIFGDKGTGKSQILDSVRKKMESDGLSVSSYISSKKDEDIKELIDSSDMFRSADKVGHNECDDSFLLIRNWGDESIESLQTFIRHGETKHMAANKDRVKFIEQQILPYDDDILTRSENDLRRINNAIESIDDIEGKYLEEGKIEELRVALANLQSAIKEKRTEEVIEKHSCGLLIYTTQQVRSIIAAKTGTVAKPPSTGFYEYTKNRISLRDAARNILENLTPKTHKERTPLGNIGDKGSLFIESRWKVIDGNPGGKEYAGSTNITTLRDSLVNIKKIEECAFSDDPQNHLDIFQEHYDNNGVVRTGVFIGTCKYIVDNDFNEYEPSNGERAIVMIQRVLNDDKDVYLLDEPELSLGGTYIDKTIRPKISKLGKAGKTVFIATHNANIAVRTLPYNTIFRYYDKSGYKTYRGNPFTNKLTDVNNPSDELDWKEISMRVLEGGEDAFKDRGQIYEAGRISK